MNQFRFVVVAVTSLGACGEPSQPRPTSPTNQVQPQSSATLLARAETALRDSTPIDYALPFAGKPLDRSRAVASYVEACKNGEHAACWLAMYVSRTEDAAAVFPLLEADCLGGSGMSCRSLPPDHESGKKFATPGVAGRSDACQEREAECDRELLRKECTGGFPTSCQELGLMWPPLPDREALLARVPELSREGCDAGILRECGVSSPKLQTLERACALDFRWCDRLGHEYVRLGQKAQARDTFERTCQYAHGSESTCAELGAAYLRNELPEPARGRGQALIDWGCPRLVEKLGAKDVAERITACALVSPK